jgi:hypothetical protein
VATVRITGFGPDLITPRYEKRLFTIFGTPAKYAEIIVVLNDLLLKTDKCPFSPYNKGMLMSKIPSRQYAVSSIRVVSLFDAQVILSAIENLASPSGFRKTSGGIFVI